MYILYNGQGKYVSKKGDCKRFHTCTGFVHLDVSVKEKLQNVPDLKLILAGL